MTPFIFIHAPKQNSIAGFYYYPPGTKKLPIPPQQCLLKIIFPEKKGGGEDYGVEKNTKTNIGIGHEFG